MKTKTAEQAAMAALSPIIDFCSKHKGRGNSDTFAGMAEIVREYGRLIGKQPDTGLRNQVEQWLTDNEARRVQPSFGAGVLLLRAFEAVKQKRRGVIKERFRAWQTERATGGRK